MNRAQELFIAILCLIAVFIVMGFIIPIVVGIVILLFLISSIILSFIWLLIVVYKELGD